LPGPSRSAENGTPAPCPCDSGTPYAHCCQPLHTGAVNAATALALMRSRYAAYVLELWPYLHASGPREQPEKTEIAAMIDWCKGKTWLGLRVVQALGGAAVEDKGMVEFVAFYREQNGLQQHHERSQFRKINGYWRFISGQAVAPVSLNRNEPCPCGSGRKYKHCCRQ